MKNIFFLVCWAFVWIPLQGQNMSVDELVMEGVKLHDQGKYTEAITYYKEALKIDPYSPQANYELAYTFMMDSQFENAILYCKKVIDNKTYFQLEAYVVLGSSYDLLGLTNEAIKAYENGLEMFPESYLLNFNLGLTLFNGSNYDYAEKKACKAVLSNPEHASSHILLSAIMQVKGERVKSILPLYYALMLEPGSKRSGINYNNLLNQLGQGVEKKGKKQIDISIPYTETLDSLFGAADMMVSMLAASKYTKENKDKSDMALFVETNKSLFGVLGELKKDNTGIFWDLYVTSFDDLVKTNNAEAFSYYISQSLDSEEVYDWISSHKKEMEQFAEWRDAY